jgi:hypothetical protein
VTDHGAGDRADRGIDDQERGKEEADGRAGRRADLGAVLGGLLRFLEWLGRTFQPVGQLLGFARQRS